MRQSQNDRGRERARVLRPRSGDDKSRGSRRVDRDRIMAERVNLIQKSTGPVARLRDWRWNPPKKAGRRTRTQAAGRRTQRCSRTGAQVNQSQGGLDWVLGGTETRRGHEGEGRRRTPQNSMGGTKAAVGGYDGAPDTTKG